MSVAIELEKLKKLRDSGAITPGEFEQSKTRMLDQCVRRIEAFYDGKEPALPRWGLPPAKVVRGAVRSIRFSQGEGKHPYGAFLNVDGCGAEIGSGLVPGVSPDAAATHTRPSEPAAIAVISVFEES